MDYEKKMTREEAIEKVRKMSLPKETVEILEALAPELRESEDERIRKALIEVFKEKLERGFEWVEYGIPNRSVLSWLEKQKVEHPKEQNQNIELIQKSWYMEGYHDRKFNKEPKWIIKTGEGGPRYEENPKYGQIIEQKPAEWVLPEDFEEAVYKVANFISPFDNQEELRKASHRFAEQLLSLAKKELDKPTEKQDYSGLNDFEQAIHRGFLCAGVQNVPVAIIKETAQDCLAQLKPAEWDKLCSNEWSEEDERNRDRAIFYTRFYQRNEGTTKGSEECIDCLKSLRPVSKESLQPHWKPSEEQEE